MPTPTGMGYHTTFVFRSAVRTLEPKEALSRCRACSLRLAEAAKWRVEGRVWKQEGQVFATEDKGLCDSSSSLCWTEVLPTREAAMQMCLRVQQAVRIRSERALEH